MPAARTQAHREAACSRAGNRFAPGSESNSRAPPRSHERGKDRAGVGFENEAAPPDLSRETEDGGASGRRAGRRADRDTARRGSERSTLKVFPAAFALLAFTGCEDSATPPTPEQQSANIESQKAAMEKFHAQNKGGRMKSSAPAEEAKPADAPAEETKPADAPPADAPPADAPKS